jgi:hypothetical protein
MDRQLPFDFEAEPTGEDLRDKGIQQAMDHANETSEKWSEIAYAFLREYMVGQSVFMAENVREASRNVVPDPPSNRAWGGVLVRAAKEGLITRMGFRNVKNTRAHCTPATLWAVNQSAFNNEKVA